MTKRYFFSAIFLLLAFLDGISQNFNVWDSVLLSAAYNNETDKALTALKNGAEPNVSYFNITPLMYAVENHNIRLVRELLKNGADPDIIPYDTVPAALSLAVINFYNDIVKLLLQSGADPDLKDLTGYTPLERAIIAENYQAMLLLLDYGATLDKQIFKMSADDTVALLVMLNYLNDSLLSEMLVVLMKKNPVSLNYVLNFITDLNGLEYKDKPLLNYALLYLQDTAILRKMTDKGADYDEKALYISLENYNPKSYKFLSHKLGKKVILPFVGRIGFSPVSVAFNGNDMFYGGYFSVSENRYFFSLRTGIYGRLWENRVLLRRSQNSYWQLWEKRYWLFATLHKDLIFKSLLFSVGVTAYYQFTEYRGFDFSTDNKLYWSPNLALSIRKRNVFYRVEYFYRKSETVKHIPHQFILSVEFSFPAIK